ncbi:hypothetical protein Tsubulata_032228 [Turnera subulata]|uniref:DUF1664 domain-containing protein n=1 Tax=Turnera subulata TaxID=218843 RepID=A0A9Q0GH45_9ROSI|nr:hypothetical protein Tsubulata_032228 [Turnera subulata]
MAMQTGVSTSKVIVLVGAGLTGSIILKNGRLSEVIAQLQELLKGVGDVEVETDKYDTTVLAAQIRQLAQEIKELTLSSPVTILNGNSSSNGSLASYLMPAAAVGAMGYCYMWWKGWSFSDVMFVTKKNMANAVATVSKQLEHVSDTVASTKRHLTKRLENLDWKVEEHMETSKLIAKDVDQMRSNLSQIGYDVETIHQMISGLEGKLEVLENKQDVTNSGLWYLCQFAEGIKDDPTTKVNQLGNGTKPASLSSLPFEERSLKGLQFIAEAKEPLAVEKPAEKNDLSTIADVKVKSMKTRIHRSYPVGFSLTRDLASAGR